MWGQLPSEGFLGKCRLRVSGLENFYSSKETSKDLFWVKRAQYDRTGLPSVLFPIEDFSENTSLSVEMKDTEIYQPLITTKQWQI